jgi:hypothetical protein
LNASCDPVFARGAASQEIGGRMIRAQLFAVVLLVLLIARLGFSDGQPAQSLTLDLHAPRAELRNELLGFTPTGSKLSDVLDFIKAHLGGADHSAPQVIEPSPGTDKDAVARKPAKKTIQLFLGRYYDQPGVIFLTAPLVMQKEVSVQWIFDEHDLLNDIVVDKRTEVY